MPKSLFLRALLPALLLASRIIIPPSSAAGVFSFAPPRNFDAGFSPVWIVVGDLNRDGHADIVVADDSSRNEVFVLLGDGAGSFGVASPVVVGSGFNAPISLALGDFDGNGTIDLAAGKKGIGNLAILSGDGAGGFGDPVGYSLENSIPESLTAGDLDGDGRLDLVFANRGTGTAGVLPGNGDGTFGELAGFPVTAPGDPLPGFSEPDSVAIGDFDKDGDPDLAVSLRVRGHVAVLRGEGDGNFADPIIVPIPDPDIILTGPTSVTAADFDGDGILDLAVTRSVSARIYAFRGEGDGRFTWVQTIAGSGRLGNAVPGDFDADGWPDLAWVRGGTSSTVGLVFVARGRGSAGFLPPESFSLFPDGKNPRFIAAGDFREDGIPDLVTANEGSGNASLLLNSVLNGCPVADAGEDRSALLGDPVLLDGLGSSDPDGDPLAFLWSLLSRPPGSTATLLDEGSPTPTLVPDEMGTYGIRLVVNDGTCDSPPDSVNVTTLTAVEIVDKLRTTAILAGEDDFKPGGFNSFRRVLDDIGNLVSKGNPGAAIRKAEDLRKHADGCRDGAGMPDRNDWIIDCHTQLTVRRLIDGLLRTLMWMEARGWG